MKDSFWERKYLKVKVYEPLIIKNLSSTLDEKNNGNKKENTTQQPTKNQRPDITIQKKGIKWKGKCINWDWKKKTLL